MGRTIRAFTKDDLAMSAEQVQAVQGLRRSSAASKHDPRPRRQRTRSGALRAALKEATR